VGGKKDAREVAGGREIPHLYITSKTNPQSQSALNCSLTPESIILKLKPHKTKEGHTKTPLSNPANTKYEAGQALDH
jgi:hypothetical protein